MPRFAANLSMMFPQLPFAERFEAAAKAGFDAVEFLFPYALPPEMVGDLLRRHGLTQALFNLPAGDWEGGERGLAALEGQERAFEASVETALTYARATGCKRLHMMAGNAPSTYSNARKTYLQHLQWAADRVAGEDVTILIEPINRRDMPGYFLNDFDKAAELITASGRKNVGLQFDIYHRQILHGDVTKALEAMLPMIGHVQVASVPHRHEPGSGELDDFRIFRHLDALRYDGFVGCEYRPAGDTLAGLQWLSEWRGRP